MNNHDSAWDRYEKARTSRHLTAMTLAEAMDKGYDTVEDHLVHYRVATRIFKEAEEALETDGPQLAKLSGVWTAPDSGEDFGEKGSPELSDLADSTGNSGPRLLLNCCEANPYPRAHQEPLRATIEVDLDPFILDGIQSLVNARLYGRDLVIIDNPDLIAVVENAVRHRTSPSVGAPNGAGVGTSDPTDGDDEGAPGSTPGAPGK